MQQRGKAATDGLGKRREGVLSRSGRSCLGNGDFRQEKEVRGKLNNLFQSRSDEGKG